MAKIIAFTIMAVVCTVCTVLLEHHDNDLVGLALFGTVASFMALMLTIFFEL